MNDDDVSKIQKVLREIRDALVRCADSLEVLAQPGALPAPSLFRPNAAADPPASMPATDGLPRLMVEDRLLQVVGSSDDVAFDFACAIARARRLHCTTLGGLSGEWQAFCDSRPVDVDFFRRRMVGTRDVLLAVVVPQSYAEREAAFDATLYVERTADGVALGWTLVRHGRTVQRGAWTP